MESKIQMLVGTTADYGSGSYVGAVGVVTSAAACDSDPSTTFIPLQHVNAAAAQTSGAVTFTKVSDTNDVWAWSGTLSYNRGAATQIFTPAALVRVNGDLTSIKIYTANGTDAFDAGQAGVVYD